MYQYGVHLKLTQCYMSFISQLRNEKKGEKRKGRKGDYLGRPDLSTYAIKNKLSSWSQKSEKPEA